MQKNEQEKKHQRRAKVFSYLQKEKQNETKTFQFFIAEKGSLIPEIVAN
jgi:hypothetical protein